MLSDSNSIKRYAGHVCARNQIGRFDITVDDDTNSIIDYTWQRAHLHLKRNPMENEWIQKLGFQALRTLGSIKSRLVLKSEVGRAFEVFEVKEFDDSIDDFWLRAQLS